MSRTLKEIHAKVIDATIRMPLPSWNWSEGVALYGLTKVWLNGGEDRLAPFLRGWIDGQLAQAKVFETVNATAPCFTLLEVEHRFADPRYRELIAGRVDFLLNRALRLKNGALEHTLVETKFGGQQWVDTLFMAGLFLVKAGLSLDQPRAVTEGLKQYRVHVELQQTENGLFYHAWDEGKGNVIGCQWARGNAWAAIVGVELLEMLPADHPDRAFIAQTLRRQLVALAACQDPSGLWTTVLTESWTYLETSAAAGIAYAVLKGLRLGLVDPQFAPMGERAWRAALAHVDYNGEFRGVSAGTGVQNHPGEYHVIAASRLEGYGQGLLLLMLSELS